MNRIESIKQALFSLHPSYLEVIDESYRHKGHLGAPTGSEYTHIKIIISNEWGDIKLVQKHRIINSLLQDEFRNGLHALSIELR
jgi:BolA protein